MMTDGDAFRQYLDVQGRFDRYSVNNAILVAAQMDTQAFKGELGSMRDVMGEIQSDMYKSMEKNKPPKSKEQER